MTDSDGTDNKAFLPQTAGIPAGLPMLSGQTSEKEPQGADGVVQATAGFSS